MKIPPNINITFEIEPIVKLFCMATSCKNNAWLMDSATCNLKHLVIKSDGRCESFEERINARTEAEADSKKET